MQKMDEVRRRAGRLEPVSFVIKTGGLRWFGHGEQKYNADCVTVEVGGGGERDVQERLG